MVTYAELKTKPKEFLAATGLRVAEFEQLLPGFKEKLAGLYPDHQTKNGQPRQRARGAGRKEKLPSAEDKLLFILVYVKTYPLQTMLGLQFGLSQPRTNYWIQALLPLLQAVLTERGMRPERDPSAVANHPLVKEGEPDLLLDGSERRRQRPRQAEAQQAAYSGKKKAHTDKNLLWVHRSSQRVLYLSPTVPGKTHDKRLADEQAIAYPSHAALHQDTGFQGYQPPGVLTFQPKKTERQGLDRLRPMAQQAPGRLSRSGRKRHCRG